MEQVLKAPIIAWPFGLFDCCPTTDGAAAAIVCRADLAHASGQPHSGEGSRPRGKTGRPYFDPTFDYLGFRSTQKASRRPTAWPALPRGTSTSPRCTTASPGPRSPTRRISDSARRAQGGKLGHEGRTALDGRHPDQSQRRPQVVRAPDRRQRRAHDLRVRPAAARRSRRAAGEECPARPRTQCRRPGRGVVRGGAGATMSDGRSRGTRQRVPAWRWLAAYVVAVMVSTPFTAGLAASLGSGPAGRAVLVAAPVASAVGVLAAFVVAV